VPGDIGDASYATRIVEDTVARFGRLDILVNSAGIMPEGGVGTADAAEWRRVIDVNVMACLHTCQAAIGPMRAQGGGDIINISSTSGRRVVALFGIYSASKFALNAMSESLRQEVGGQGIRVCVIEPGATTTELWENIHNPALRQSVQQLAQRDESIKPEDIADAILFVATLPPRVNVSEMLIRPTTDVAPM
jgi:NADP-dependent 3-hydroxy acid dehydrogenase YdfG